MKRNLMVKNLGCANCAEKMERAISKLPGVVRCQISFLTGKMALEAEEDQMERVIAEAKGIVRKVEPDAELIA